MIDIIDIKQIIEVLLPDIHVSIIEYLGKGDFCTAFVVNREWVFRFAHNQEGSEKIEREILILPKLAKSVSLKIPEIQYFTHDPKTSLSIVGYRMIPGIQLSNELLQQLHHEKQENVARRLAEFLDGLHSYSTENMRQMGVPEYDYPAQFTEDIDKVCKLVYPIIEHELRYFCEQIIHEHLESGYLEYKSALLHDDLSQWHIFFDPSSNELTGIIDFSDMIIGDPIQDLMYLYDNYGINFVKILLEYQCHADLNKTLQRVHSYHECHTLRRLLWAIENGHNTMITKRINQLQELCNFGTFAMT